MALSGTFSNKWKPNQYGGYTYKIEWTATQNVSGNYSTITCKHYLICDATYGLGIGSRTITCTVNSVSKTCTTPNINTNGNTTISLGTTSYTINHASDGTASFSLSSAFPMEAYISGSYKGSISVSGSATLNTIPRASSMTFPEFTMGSAGTININRASSAFTHTITYSFCNKNDTIVDKTSDTSISWTPNLNELAEQIPDKTREWGTFILTTYSGSTEIGKTSYTFYCNLPNNIGPTLNQIVISPNLINDNDILIQNKNKLQIGVMDSTAGLGSSIKSYSFVGPGVSVVTSAPIITIGPIAEVGELTYTVKITDTRGRTDTKTASIISYGYSSPSFKSFNAYLDDGKIKCDYEVVYSDVNNTNEISVQFYYKKGAGNWTSIGSALSQATMTGSVVLSTVEDSTYVIRASVADSYGASITSGNSTIFGKTRIINITNDGTGVAIGKMAESSNMFECRWRMKVDDVITTEKPIDTLHGLSYRGTNLINTPEEDTIENWNNQGNLATSYYNTDDQLNGQPSTNGLLLNVTNGPGYKQAHQLWMAQNNDESIYHRDGDSSGIKQEWKEILDSSNYTKYVAYSDYVIEDGTSDSWTYRKWNNGNAECWLKFRGTESYYTQCNGFYGYSATKDFPKDLFITAPIVQYSVLIGSGFAINAGGNRSTKDTFRWQVLSNVNTANAEYTVEVYAIGKWK